MIKNEHNGILFFKYRNLGKFSELWHGVFARCAGHSRKPFSSLNISFGLGDERSVVEKNRAVIRRCIGKNDIVYVNQNHGTEILTFCKEDNIGTPIAFDDFLVADAMVSDIANKFLAVQVADCQPIFLYDPICRVVANVHAGWRGSVKNILGLTVTAMKEQFGSHPEHIHAGVGPSLGPCCAEFRNYRSEIPEIFWKYKDKDHHFDFWSITCDQLTAHGVLSENIDVSRICTKCNTDLFFSYRGEGVTGRFAGVIGLK